MKGGLGAILAACAPQRPVSRPRRPVRPAKPRYPKRTGKGLALIVNGDHWERDTRAKHKVNIIRACRFLYSIGYGTSEVVVLAPPWEHYTASSEKGLAKLSNMLGFDLPKISGPATKKNIAEVLDRYERIIKPEQDLFAYFTGHGISKNGHSNIQLTEIVGQNKKAELSDTELKAMLKDSRFRQGIVLSDGCGGKGFSTNIGDDRLTAIALTDFGQSEPCVYFAEYFFNIMWNRSADKNGDGNVHLVEAVTRAHDIIKSGGVKSTLTVMGKYDPVLQPSPVNKHYPRRRIEHFFMPNSRVQSMPQRAIESLLKKPNVILIDSKEKAKQAMQDPNARVYLRADGCGTCKYMDEYLEDAVDDKNTKKIYVISAKYDKKERSITLGVALDLFKYFKSKGFRPGGIPALARLENGKVTYIQKGVPKKVHSYGRLTDKRVRIYDRRGLDKFLND